MVAAQHIAFQQLLTLWFVVHLLTLINSKRVWLSIVGSTTASFLTVVGVYEIFAPEIHFQLTFVFALFAAAMMPVACVGLWVYRRLNK